MLMPELKGITQLAAGANHVLALDNKGKVQAWGSGQQSQLARRVFEGHMKGSLRPAGIGNLPVRGAKAVKVATGSYHSFVIDNQGRVFSWGLNSFGETGIMDNAGEDAAVTQRPTLVESLSDYKIKEISGGGHHSLACTEDGKLLSWGRIDGHQVGLPMSTFNEENAQFDEHGKPRILLEPTVLEKVQDAVFVECGTDNCFAITAEGKAYAWGFSANYQTGLGTDDDVEEPTLIDNTAVKEKKLIWAGAGGQYSALASPQDEPAEA
jgi:regulator of chromosome condensation